MTGQAWETSTAQPVATRRNWRPVVAVVAALALVVLVGVVVRMAANHGDSHSDVCRQAYAARIGHDLNDTSFWLVLQDCARRGELPDGANDPGYYQ